MTTLKVNRFSGIYPRLDRRNIPVGGAQRALNVRFDSGDLRPFMEPSLATTLTAGDIGHLFWYRHQADDGQGRYISFGRDLFVQGFRSPVPNDEFRRWYWNVSDEGLRFIANPLNPTPSGVAGAVGAGTTFRQFQGARVGIPAPQSAPEVANTTAESAVGYDADVAVVSIARTNPIRINTSAAHNFESGWRVQILIDPSLPKPQDNEDPDGGLPGDDQENDTVGQIWQLDGAQGIVGNVESTGFDIIGISGTVFSEFDADDLAAIRVYRIFNDDDLESRVYLWTYVSQYGEEGPPSEASNIIDVPKENAQVTIDIGDVLHNQTIHGGSRDYINRIRLYRSVAGNTGLKYLLVGELQYSGSTLPDDTEDVSVMAMEPQVPGAGTDVWLFMDTLLPDTYATGDIIQVLSTEDAQFGFETRIIGFFNAGPGFGSGIKTNTPAADVNLAGQPDGIYITKGLGVSPTDGVSWLSAPNSANPAGPWSATLAESVEAVSLGDEIKSMGWFPPPNGLTGVAVMGNGVIAAWKGNTVYFCDRYLPHAWDPDNALTLSDEIIGGESYGNTLVLGTRGRPYVVTGIDPSAMVDKKVEFHAPLTDKASIHDAGFGVLYISHDGLVMINQAGPKYLTKSHFTEKEWLETIKKRNRIAFYDGLAFIYGAGEDDGSGGHIAYEPLVGDINGDQINFSNVDLDMAASASVDGELAIVTYGPASEYRQVYIFKTGNDPMDAVFHSGMLAVRRPVNPAVAQVYADGYPITLKIRTIRPTSYPEPVAGQPDIQTFDEKAYTVQGPEPFWLVAGYLTREFEFEIETTNRIQEVVISTSMDELKTS